MHTGVDLVMNSGTPIYATGDGVVHTVKSEATGYGRQIVIDHGFGYKSRYAHMSELLLKVGTPVKRGDLIGLSGNTGTSTGAHLHHEVLYKDAQVNPANYFDLSITPQEYAVMVPQSVKEEKK
jgi:murein DD-endopeptidase MepM/ murein hydrolase activator NlpD